MDFKLTNSYSPTLFTTDGYQVVVMPMATNEANEQAKRDREAKQAEQAKAEAVTPTEPQAEAEPIAEREAEPVADKPKRTRKVKEPVAVA